jgi:ABC-type uncharacterized transport system, periplasmic component
MRRRTFIAGLGGAAAWPVVARAQQPGKVPTIGFLGPASAFAMKQWTAAFVERLRELGWIEGRTVAIEYRWTEGHGERLPEVAAEFNSLKVDVIVTTGSAVPAFKQVTSVIPIVFAIANDPVGSGLVESISRPGGNVTGLSILAADLGGKRLEILREVIPGLSRLATLGDAANLVTASEMGQVQEAARTLGLEIVRSEIRRAEDIAPAIEALKRPRGRTVCSIRPAYEHQSDADQYLGTGRTAPNAFRYSGLRRSRRSYVLWTKLPRYLPARRRLCR